MTPQLKAIVIAGGLAVLALALGFLTLSMNQPSSDAAVKTIQPLHARHTATPATATPVASKPKPKAKPKPKPDAHVTAALAAGLPKSIATMFATHRVVVVELYSPSDEVDGLARDEASAGAAAADAGFLAVNADADGDSAGLTKILGALPPAPAALIYARPASLYVTLSGFNDRAVVEQAAANAAAAPAGTTATAAAAPVATTPAAPTTAAPTSTDSLAP